MEGINFNSFMDMNPTKLGSVVNQSGQTVDFYECPIFGGAVSVIAICEVFKAAVFTDFFDLSDFYKGSEYNPIFIKQGQKAFIPYYLLDGLSEVGYNELREAV